MSKIEEKIDEAAQEYAKSLWGVGMYEKETPATEEDMTWAFKAGAKWALSHQWVSEEDAQPGIRESVLAISVSDGVTEIGVAWISEYPDKTLHWFSSDDCVDTYDIKYWMPIPPLPEARKEGEK